MLSRGDMVRDYEIIAPLRSGGMALVYLARRRGVGGFNRLVVLKLVHPDLVEDAKMTSLFLAEARLSAQVAHPNVVHVEEVGRQGRTYFIAMEYVHGVTLSELLATLVDRKLRMNPKLCVWVAAQIAEALHAVHEARGENDAPLQIVHRDVSPQNVLVGLTGHVKLIDFGIAKSQRGDDSTTNGSAVLGKLGYMAPEQFRLETVDRRTDVYALGVMLWEMLCARSLFRCQRIDDERDWATREEPPSPQQHAPISDALGRVVQKALAPDPRDRFSTAFSFRAALLRAAPECMQVDAPRFAALMRSLIGDELARRRAGWPLEIGVQLELDAELTTQKAISISELTAPVRPAEARASALAIDNDDSGSITLTEPPPGRHIVAALDVEEPAGDPTRIEGSAQRLRSGGVLQIVDLKHALPPICASEPSAVQLAALEGTSHARSAQGSRGELIAISEAMVITQPSPRVRPWSRARALASSTWSSSRARAFALGTGCLVLGVLLGVGVRSGDSPAGRRWREAAGFHASQTELTAASAPLLGDAAQRYASTGAGRHTRALASPPVSESARRQATPEPRRSSKVELKRAPAARAATGARTAKLTARSKLGSHVKRFKSGR